MTDDQQSDYGIRVGSWYATHDGGLFRKAIIDLGDGKFYGVQVEISPREAGAPKRILKEIKASQSAALMQDAAEAIHKHLEGRLHD